MEVESSSDRVAEPGPEDWFTGEVWLERIVEASRPGRLRAHRVTFAPRARTAWHSHPLGQALEILSGVALVGLADGPGRRLAAGDRVWFEPGERHWHGAAPDSVMSHLALQEAGEDGVEAEWGDHVADADYESAAGRS